MADRLLRLRGVQTGVIETFRWLRVIGDTIFAAGALALGAFVIGLPTGGTTRTEKFRVPSAAQRPTSRSSRLVERAGDLFAAAAEISAATPARDRESRAIPVMHSGTKGALSSPRPPPGEEVLMFTPVILTIPTLVLPLLLSSPTRDCQFGRMGDPAADERALTTFEVAVNDYVDLHRRLERAWPPMWFIADLEQLESAAEEFRTVLRDARPQAAQGSFFTPDVADVFRFRIANALRERNYDPQAMTSSGDEEGTAGWWKPLVNESAPRGAVGAFWPVVENLPELPLELEYRFVGRDLVLLDVHANLVVDVLDLALPSPVGPDRENPVRPPAPEKTAPHAEERIRPFGEEPSGCWYGEGPDLHPEDEQEDRDR